MLRSSCVVERCRRSHSACALATFATSQTDASKCVRFAASSTDCGHFSSFSKNAPRIDTAVSACPDCGIFDEFEYRSTNQLLTTTMSVAVGPNPSAVSASRVRSECGPVSNACAPAGASRVARTATAASAQDRDDHDARGQSGLIVRPYRSGGRRVRTRRMGVGALSRAPRASR